MIIKGVVESLLLLAYHAHLCKCFICLEMSSSQMMQLRLALTCSLGLVLQHNRHKLVKREDKVHSLNKPQTDGFTPPVSVVILKDII